jgi:phosphoglycerate kinase
MTLSRSHHPLGISQHLSSLTPPPGALSAHPQSLSERLAVQTITDLGDLTNKTVLLRVDANVSPASEMFQHHPRIKQVASTLEQLSAAGARTIVMSHRSLGDDSREEETSNGGIVERLRTHFQPLDSTLHFHQATEMERARTLRGERSYFRRLHTLVKELPSGHSIFLENTRLFPSERSEVASGRLKQLSSLADYIVYDGFGVGHRGRQLSVDGLMREFPFERKCLGPAALAEWDQVLSFTATTSPYSVALVLGGDVDKFESKLHLVIEMLKSDRVGLVYLGGVFGTSWLHVHGCDLEKTPVSKNGRALDTLSTLPARFPHIRFELPSEYVGLSPSKELSRWPVLSDKRGHPYLHIPHGGVALDQPARDLAPILNESGISQVVAVGPLGYYSRKPFNTGTVGTYRALAHWAQAGTDRKLLLGGGNSMEALLGIPDFQSPQGPSIMVSSGGGALLNAVAEAFKTRGEASLIQTPSLRALRRSRHEQARNH